LVLISAQKSCSFFATLIQIALVWSHGLQFPCPLQPILISAAKPLGGSMSFWCDHFGAACFVVALYGVA